jgi:hypothetical protein
MSAADRTGADRPWLPLPAVLLAACCIGACGGGSPPASRPASSAPPQQRVVAQTDLEIAQLLYAGGPRTPSGFYAETLRPGATYLTLTHLKNSDVADLAADAPVHELCSDDLAEALSWTAAAAARAPTVTDLVETGGDQRLFEFVRATREAGPRLVVHRVFKCAYLDRTGVDLHRATGVAGTLRKRPFDAADLRLLAEYLWTFSQHNNSGSAVLASRDDPDAPGTLHDAVMARVEAGAAGACDRIVVLSWRHRADPATGRLSLEEVGHFAFAARQDAAGVRVCTP